VIPSTAPDRRAALKARHREAILDAARALVDEQGGPRFSVDELAKRADVARRTIFNHFASIDEILLTLCGDALDVIIDDFIADVAAAPRGDGSRASMFAELASTLRSADLPAAIAKIASIIGEPAPEDPRGRALSDEAFGRAADRLVAAVSQRNPGVDRLETEFLVGSLMNGVIVVANHWIANAGVRLDDDGRQEWQRLLTRLIDAVRSGYQPVS
jgi:TetR/AcrR family transcriptional regulator of autoinduction and epiphytic fitness